MSNLEINAERDRLVIEKTAISSRLAEIGFTGNKSRYLRAKAPELFEERQRLAIRYAKIDERLTEIRAFHKTEVEKQHKKRDADVIFEILRETFGYEFTGKILKEFGNRKELLPPVIVSPPKTNQVTNCYKTELQEAYEILLAGRKAINSWIDKNEPEINKAAYYQSVATLSKSLPSVQEIEKLNKRLNYIQK